MCHIINLLSITDKCHKTVCFIYLSLCYRCRLPSPALLLHRGWSTLYNMDGLDQLLLGFFGISCLLLLIYGIIYVICLTCHSVGLLPSRFSNKVSSPATNIDRYLHILLYCAPNHYSKHSTKHCFFCYKVHPEPTTTIEESPLNVWALHSHHCADSHCSDIWDSLYNQWLLPSLLQASEQTEKR